LPQRPSQFFAVRTTAGRELDVALIIENRARVLREERGIDARAIVVPPGIKGYVFVEAPNLGSVYPLITDVKYVKRGQLVKVKPEEIERLVKPKPVIEMVNEGDIVEIIRGPFRVKAQVVSVDRNKNMVMLSILEAAFNVPITVPGDYVKPVKKGGG